MRPLRELCGEDWAAGLCLRNAEVWRQELGCFDAFWVSLKFKGYLRSWRRFKAVSELLCDCSGAGHSWVCSDLLLWNFSSLVLQEGVHSEVPNPGDGLVVVGDVLKEWF